MKKIALVMLILVVVIIGVGLLLKTCSEPNKPPSLSAAPFKIQTDGRYYFAKTYSEGVDSFGKNITLVDYWYTNDGETWLHNSGSRVISYRGYKTVKVIIRQATDDSLSP